MARALQLETQSSAKQKREINYQPAVLAGKVSAQPHTIVKQICFPNGNVLFLSLFSLFKNWMHNVGWGCTEILPGCSEVQKTDLSESFSGSSASYTLLSEMDLTDADTREA